MRIRDDKTFDATLDSIQSQPASTGRTGTGAFAHPMTNLGVPPGPPMDCGGGYLWDHALAWVPEYEPPETPTVPPPHPPPTIDVESITRELGLAKMSTPGELRLARRRFMWENHPDRNPELPASLANRRVAIANMLVDRALETLPRPQRGE